MNRTVFVTGASGYTAKHLCLQLLDARYRVHGSVRSARRADEVLAALKPHLADPSNLETRLDFAELELHADTGWDEAMHGADVLIHTASPFGPGDAVTEEDVARAVGATLRVLRAAAAAGMNRVIVTSSMAAIIEADPPPPDRIYTERDWSDTANPMIDAYARAKTLCERAAWDFVGNEAPGMVLTTINPGLIVGPPLDSHFDDAFALLQRVIRSECERVPNFGFACGDVRDVAAMHLRAINRPAAFGERLIGAAGYLTLPEMARIVADAWPDRVIATQSAPGGVARRELSNAKARRVLDMDFIPAEDSVRDTARFMIENGLAG